MKIERIDTDAFTRRRKRMGLIALSDARVSRDFGSSTDAKEARHG